MESLNREELQKYLNAKINHQDNPQLFKKQVQAEIAKHLKAHQMTIKQYLSQSRVHKLQDQSIKKRQQATMKMDQQLKKAQKKRQQLLNARVKSMSMITLRRQSYVAQKLKINRAQQLKKSLKIIKQIEQKKEDMWESKLRRSESQINIQSRRVIKQKKDNQDYVRMMDELRDRKIYQGPPRKQLQELYQRKGQRIRVLQKEMVDQSRIGKQLDSIKSARSRKDKKLHEISAQIRYINDSKQANKKQNLKSMAQLSYKKKLEEEKNKRKKLLQSQKQEITLNVQKRKTLTHSLHSTDRHVDKITLLVDRKSVPKSYRQEIRKQINSYLNPKK